LRGLPVSRSKRFVAETVFTRDFGSGRYENLSGAISWLTFSAGGAADVRRSRSDWRRELAEMAICSQRKPSSFRCSAADNPPFRRRVGCPVFRAMLPSGRGGQDDASAAALHHMRCEGPNGVRRARQVDVDRNSISSSGWKLWIPAFANKMSVPPNSCSPLTAAARSAGRSRWSSLMPSQRRAAARTSRPVSSKSSGDGTTPERGSTGAQIIETDDVGALTGEGDGRGAADPAGGAGDHGHLATQAFGSCRFGHSHSFVSCSAWEKTSPARRGYSLVSGRRGAYEMASAGRGQKANSPAAARLRLAPRQRPDGAKLRMFITSA
jgi:hypothetical protein